MSDVIPRRACYLVCPERTYFVTTIDYRNPIAPSFDCIESGIRDISKYRDGRRYDSYKEHMAAIPFTLCQHDIWPLDDGHAAVIGALKQGVAPDEVYRFLREGGRDGGR